MTFNESTIICWTNLQVLRKAEIKALEKLEEIESRLVEARKAHDEVEGNALVYQHELAAKEAETVIRDRQKAEHGMRMLGLLR